MASHAPDLPERSHPLLWTIGLVAIMAILVGWFSHWFGAGRAHGRSLVIPVEKPAEPPVDHQKLIDDRSEAVIDKGRAIFSKTCAACHGPTGAENPTGLQPPPRNFHKDAFMNPNGAGPYGLYTVLENGFNGRMPAQTGLTPEQKYAVIHFIRETVVKTDNAANYLPEDTAATKAKIPKVGEGADAGPQLPPPERPVDAPVIALIAGIAASTADETAAADAWIARAAGDGQDDAHQPSPDLRRMLGGLAAHRGSGALVSLYRLARAGDHAAMRALLRRGDSTLYLPGIVGGDDAQIEALLKYLAAQAAVSTTADGAKPVGKGAK